MTSRTATLVIIALLGVYMVHGPPAMTIPQSGDWTPLSSCAATGALIAPSFACNMSALAMGPDPGGKSGTQAIPDNLESSRSNGMLRTSGLNATDLRVDVAEYEAGMRECDALDGNARFHCIEYVKLRSRN